MIFVLILLLVFAHIFGSSIPLEYPPNLSISSNPRQPKKSLGPGAKYKFVTLYKSYNKYNDNSSFARISG